MTRRESVKREVFVAAYKTALKEGHTCADLAKTLNMPAQQVSMRASNLRKRMKEEYSVNLPKLKRANSTNTVDLEDLAEFLQPTE